MVGRRGCGEQIGSRFKLRQAGFVRRARTKQEQDHETGGPWRHRSYSKRIDDGSDDEDDEDEKSEKNVENVVLALLAHTQAGSDPIVDPPADRVSPALARTQPGNISHIFSANGHVLLHDHDISLGYDEYVTRSDRAFLGANTKLDYSLNTLYVRTFIHARFD